MKIYIIINYNDAGDYMFTTLKDITKWLHSMDIEFYSIRENNTVDVQQDVRITRKLTELPVQFGVIDGSFNCSGTGLITLKGCPEKVTGFFNCDDNQLKSLQYCPKEVWGYFSCNYNKLESLLYAPEYINESFYCDNNNLTSLKHGPKSVSDSFTCNNNNLVNLIGCPSELDGDMSCIYNQLTSFEGFPDTINGFLFFSHNNIPEEQLVYFNTVVGEDIENNFDMGKEEFLSKVSKMKEIKREKEALSQIIANNFNENNVKKRL